VNTTFDRYLISRYLQIFLILFVSVFGLYVVIDGFSNVDEFQEHAAGALEEVAFAISAGVDFVAEMQERGLSVDRITESVSFSFAMGPEFFIQIAKLRAFRLVWAKAFVIGLEMITLDGWQ